MKILKSVFLLTIFALVVVSCKDVKPEVKTVETALEPISKPIHSNAKLAKVEFTVNGMTCAMGCAKTIEKKMAKMEGVKFAKVDFDRKLAMVEYDEAIVTAKSLEATVKKAGDSYEVKNLKQVTAFSAEKACEADCKKACCSKDAKAKTEDKTACAKDCKKACCSKESKA